MLQNEYKDTATFYLFTFYFMNTVLWIIFLILAIVGCIAIIVVFYTLRGGKFEAEIRKHLEAEFKLKTEQAFDIINATRDEHEAKAKKMLDDIHKKNIEADERLAKAKDKESTIEQDKQTALSTIAKTEQNYKEAHEYLQTAKDKEAAADARFKESKKAYDQSSLTHREEERKRLIVSLGNFIRGNYSSEQTKTKLSAFVRHFVEQLETV